MASRIKSISWRVAARGSNGSRVFRDDGLSAGISVYHYLEYPHALAIFTDGRLRLADPARWPDPYEQGWYKRILGGSGLLRQTSAYALCWSRSHFDEPAWRMAGFQRTNPIVRIRCRLRDILAAAGGFAEQRSGAFFAGEVRYEHEEELRQRTKSLDAGPVKEPARAAANLLLRKRKAFRFEKEVRTLWLDSEPQNTALFLPIDPKLVVRQVMCSPHAHPDQRTRIHEEFKERFGIHVVDPGIPT